MTIPRPTPPYPLVIATGSAHDPNNHPSGYLWRRGGSAMPKGARVVAMVDSQGTVVSCEPVDSALLDVIDWAVHHASQSHTSAAEQTLRILDELEALPHDAGYCAATTRVARLNFTDAADIKLTLQSLPGGTSDARTLLTQIARGDIDGRSAGRAIAALAGVAHHWVKLLAMRLVDNHELYDGLTAHDRTSAAV